MFWCQAIGYVSTILYVHCDLFKEKVKRCIVIASTPYCWSNCRLIRFGRQIHVFTYLLHTGRIPKTRRCMTYTVTSPGSGARGHKITRNIFVVYKMTRNNIVNLERQPHKVAVILCVLRELRKYFVGIIFCVSLYIARVCRIVTWTWWDWRLILRGLLHCESKNKALQYCP